MDAEASVATAAVPIAPPEALIAYLQRALAEMEQLLNDEHPAPPPPLVLADWNRRVRLYYQTRRAELLDRYETPAGDVTLAFLVWRLHCMLLVACDATDRSPSAASLKALRDAHILPYAARRLTLQGARTSLYSLIHSTGTWRAAHVPALVETAVWLRQRVAEVVVFGGTPDELDAPWVNAERTALSPAGYREAERYLFYACQAVRHAQMVFAVHEPPAALRALLVEYRPRLVTWVERNIRFSAPDAVLSAIRTLLCAMELTAFEQEEMPTSEPHAVLGRRRPHALDKIETMLRETATEALARPGRLSAAMVMSVLDNFVSGKHADTRFSKRMTVTLAQYNFEGDRHLRQPSLCYTPWGTLVQFRQERWRCATLEDGAVLVMAWLEREMGGMLTPGRGGLCLLSEWDRA